MAIRRGTSAADVINGTPNTDWLFGRGGNDRMRGGGGEDALWGDAGDDVLRGDAGADFLSGGTGNDRLDGGGINNVLHGDDGNDTLLYNPGRFALVPGIDYGGQRMEGGRGYDTLRVGGDAYFVEGGGARTPAQLDVSTDSGGGQISFVHPDRLTYVPAGTFTGMERFELTSPTHSYFSSPPANGADIPRLHVVGSRGDDLIEVHGGASVRVEGGGGSDTFNLSMGDIDVVLNPGAADRVTVVYLTAGEQRVYGFGAGDTVMIFDALYGPVRVTEAGGSTTIAGTREGQTGSVVIDAVGLVQNAGTFSFGADTVARGVPPPAWPQVAPSGEPPSPRDVWGTSGSDTIAGTAARERIFAGGGNDRVTGGNGDDLIYGGGGNDRLWGERGYDRIFGGAGDDVIGFGTDGGEIHGGSGNDVMFFDPGAVDLSYDGGSGRIDGGEGFDTLRVTNRAIAGWGDDPVGPATTDISLAGPYSGFLNEPTLGIGAYGDEGIEGARLRFHAIERIEVTSDASRPVVYSGGGSSLPSMQLVAGAGNDRLFSGEIDEVLEGGRGNDFFQFGGGRDTFISRTDDADIFEIGRTGGAVRIRGFNGAGSAGGDTIRITEAATVTRNQGTTIFDWGEGRAVVDSGDLVEGSDYSFV